MSAPNRFTLSIITIVLNGVDEVRGTIESVIEQKASDVEYIVVDGGSTDGTVDIVAEYNSSIDCFISGRDNGIYNAINKGLAVAKGAYVGLINCGDSYVSGAVDIVLEFCRNGRADAYYGDIEICEAIDGQPFRHVAVANHAALKKRMSIYHPACFIRRKVHAGGWRYNEQFKIAADYDLLLRMFIAGHRFVHIPHVLARFKAGGISSRLRTRVIAETIRIRMSAVGKGDAILFGGKAYALHLMTTLARAVVRCSMGERRFQRWRAKRRSRLQSLNSG